MIHCGFIGVQNENNFLKNCGFCIDIKNRICIIRDMKYKAVFIDYALYLQII